MTIDEGGRDSPPSTATRAIGRCHRWGPSLLQPRARRRRARDSDSGTWGGRFSTPPGYRTSEGRGALHRNMVAGATSVAKLSREPCSMMLLLAPCPCFRRGFSQLTNASMWARAPCCSTICLPQRRRQRPRSRTRQRAHCGPADVIQSFNQVSWPRASPNVA